jgi:uncharacterized protein YkwD
MSRSKSQLQQHLGELVLAKAPLRVPRGSRVLRFLLVTLAMGVVPMAPAVSGASAGRAAAADCPNADLVPAVSNVKQIRAAVLCLTNADRAQRRLPLLKENPKLRKAALAHSSEMVAEGYFGHTTLDGATFVDRIVGSGYVRGSDGWTLGENLGSGTGELCTAGGIHGAWMSSRGHKANILKRAYREIGIGIRLGVPTDDGVGATFTTDFGVTA